MANPKILITSAAGNTGMRTALQLLAKGFPVRALVRSDDHRAASLKAAGAQIFVGDQYSVTDTRQAMDGVQRAYHCAPSAPTRSTSSGSSRAMPSSSATTADGYPNGEMK